MLCANWWCAKYRYEVAQPVDMFKSLYEGVGLGLNGSLNGSAVDISSLLILWPFRLRPFLGHNSSKRLL